MAQPRSARGRGHSLGAEVRERLRDALRRTPGASNLSIARDVGVNDKTVARERRELIEYGELNSDYRFSRHGRRLDERPRMAVARQHRPDIDVVDDQAIIDAVTMIARVRMGATVGGRQREVVCTIEVQLDSSLRDRGDDGLRDALSYISQAFWIDWDLRRYWGMVPRRTRL
jgi:hypothetical protein